jgi:ribonuclease T1
VTASRVHVPRRLRLPALLAGMVMAIATALAGPAVFAPDQAPQANAAVYSSCTMSRCSAARTARTGWQQLGFPTTRGWRSWPSGKYNYSGGQYDNREAELPRRATYYEYDVYPRAKGAARDAFRIIVNKSSGATWFSPNHYGDFYRL